MKRSQIALLSAAVVLVLIIAGGVIAARIIVARIASGGYEAEVPARQEPGQPALTGDLDLSGFDRIDARGHWRITLVQGENWNVSLSYPKQMKDRLRVRVQGDRLVLGYQEGGFRLFGNEDSVTARIVMPKLAAVDLAGAGTLDLSGFSGETLSIASTGASQIKGHDGRYANLDLTVTGAGDADLTELPVDDARVVLSGAGQATLTMNGGSLSGAVSGVGQIRYHGSVSEQNVVTSGFSSVKPLD